MPEKFNSIKVSRTRDNLIFIMQPRARNCVKTRVYVCAFVLLEFKDDDLEGKPECKNA